MGKMGLERWSLEMFQKDFETFQRTAKLPRHYWLYVNNFTEEDNLWTHIQDWVAKHNSGCYRLCELEQREQSRVVNYIYQTIKGRWDEEDGTRERKRLEVARETALKAAQGDLFPEAVQ